MSLNYLEINQILDELNLCGFTLQNIKALNNNETILFFTKDDTIVRILLSLDPLNFRIHRVDYKIDYPKIETKISLNLKRFIGFKISNISQILNNRIIKILFLDSLEEIYIKLWGGDPNLCIYKNGKLFYLWKQSKSGFKIDSLLLNTYKCSLKNHSSRDYNTYISNYYRGLITQSTEEITRLKIEKEISIRENQIKGLELKLNEYNKAIEFKEIGDLLISNIHLLKKGQESVILDNFFTGGKIEISLDPGILPRDQAMPYYKKHKKAKLGITHIQNRIYEIKSQIDKIRESGLIVKGQNAASKGETQGGVLYHGFEILVGKSAKENDSLLRTNVRGNDIWLHARDFPGGYVFIKTKKGKSIPLDVLIYAGNLALLNSKGKNNGKGEIYYTEVKYLRRVKNGKLGQVIPTKSKNIFISMDLKLLNKV